MSRCSYIGADIIPFDDHSDEIVYLQYTSQMFFLKRTIHPACRKCCDYFIKYYGGFIIIEDGANMMEVQKVLDE